MVSTKGAGKAKSRSATGRDSDGSDGRKGKGDSAAGLPHIMAMGRPRAPALRREPDVRPITAARYRSPLMSELGTTGLDVRSGHIYDDYSSRLQTLALRMQAFEEMRRSDSALAAMEAVITLPIRHADWRVEAGTDKELAERIAQNLFAGLSHPFDDIIREALLAPLYGFTMHEKVFERKARGFMGWRKFPERSRTSVDAWQFDETGGLAGIKQRGNNPATGRIQETEIPIEKLIVWTWRKQYNNPEGLGAFRQAYKHWMYKQYFEEFAAIRIERQACGIPMATGPAQGYTQSEAEDMLTILGRLRTAEDAGIVKPEGWQIELLELGRSDVPFETHIERQHQSMLQTVLAQFVGLAQGGDSGAWALSRDSSTFFLMSLEAAADWICETFNRYAIDQIVDYNGGDKESKPRLTHGPIGVRDPELLSRALQRIFNDKTRLPLEVEDYVRDELGLPERPPAPDGERQAPQPEPTPPEE